jgi:ubiquitin-protein ligase E3 C
MRLLPRPLSLFPDNPIVESAMLPPLINTLLALPQLPSSLPITSLTHLTKSLPIISKLLPYAAANPAVLRQNSLATELGKTHLLANLGFMVIQTGAIQQQDMKSVVAWVNVLTQLLEGVDDQWGLWLENKGVWGKNTSAAVQTAAVVDSMERNDLDSERNDQITTRKRNIQDRGSVPPGIVNRVLSIVGTDHLNFLTSSYIRQPAMTQPYIRYMLALLTKFRGSVRFDGIMEVLGGQSGTRLVRDLWRNQVRGKWPSAASKQTWDRLLSPTAGDTATASDMTRLQSLLLLTHIYIHHLLTVTDEEFFAPPSRDAAALSLDEVIELSGIWRDVAFWGYWSGLGNGLGQEIVKQKEEIRGLMTKGVLAITARE